MVKALRVMSRPLAFCLFACGLNCVCWRERDYGLDPMSGVKIIYCDDGQLYCSSSSSSFWLSPLFFSLGRVVLCCFPFLSMLWFYVADDSGHLYWLLTAMWAFVINFGLTLKCLLIWHVINIIISLLGIITMFSYGEALNKFETLNF